MNEAHRAEVRSLLPQLFELSQRFKTYVLLLLVSHPLRGNLVSHPLRGNQEKNVEWLLEGYRQRRWSNFNRTQFFDEFKFEFNKLITPEKHAHETATGSITTHPTQPAIPRSP